MNGGVRKLHSLQSYQPSRTTFRPELSPEGLAEAQAYGLSTLDSARADCAARNCMNWHAACMTGVATMTMLPRF